MTAILMLGAIADVARSHGEHLSKLGARLACVEVFAYGERRSDMDYYASRALLSRLSAEASALLLQRGAAGVAAPAAAALTGEVATRFSVVVWEKLAASAVPLASPAGAAAINIAFVNHFQRIARGGGGSAFTEPSRCGVITKRWRRRTGRGAEERARK